MRRCCPIIIALLSFTACAEEADVDKSFLIGKYSSISESECDIELSLKARGKGESTQLCRLENGSHADVANSISFEWAHEKSRIIVQSEDFSAEFSYGPVSCEEFGSNGSSIGLTLENEKNIFFGQYGRSFWKLPVTCEED